MKRTVKVLKGFCSFSRQFSKLSSPSCITNGSRQQPISSPMRMLLETGTMLMKHPCAELSSMRLSTSSKREVYWNDMYNKLLEYKKEHGDCLVPFNYPQLGPWVQRQRVHFRHMEEGTTSVRDEARKEALCKIEFVWEVHLRWEARFEELTRYKEKFGHCNVSKVDEDYRDLWMWVFVQRREYAKRKEGEPNSISDERIKALETIGFVWNAHEEMWFYRLEELIEYKAYHGDCIVPQRYESNPQLAKWVAAQRNHHQRLKSGKYSPLSQERIELLDREGFVWNVHDHKWNLRLEELKDFAEFNGHTRVPRKYPLYNWIGNQRKEYQQMIDGEKSTMTESRANNLKALGVF